MLKSHTFLTLQTFENLITHFPYKSPHHLIQILSKYSSIHPTQPNYCDPNPIIIMSAIRVTLDKKAGRVKKDKPQCRLKFGEDEFISKIYPYLPQNLKNQFNNQQSISLRVRDIQTEFEASMLLVASRRECRLGMGVWYHYAEHRGLSEGSKLLLTYDSSEQQLHIALA